MKLQLDDLKNTYAFDIGKAVIGVGLALTPWLLGFAGVIAAAANAWIIGAAMTLIALAAMYWSGAWAPWVQLVLGLWAIIAPYALGFAALTAALGAHIVAGILVAVIALVELWFIHNRPLSTV